MKYKIVCGSKRICLFLIGFTLTFFSDTLIGVKIHTDNDCVCYKPNSDEVAFYLCTTLNLYLFDFG